MTADGGVGDVNFIGQGGDEVVAGAGEFGGDVRGRGGDRRLDRHPAAGNGFVPCLHFASGFWIQRPTSILDEVVGNALESLRKLPLNGNTEETTCATQADIDIFVD